MLNRLATRLVLSHLLVVGVGAVVTFVVVRQLAPRLFDSSVHQMRGMGTGAGAGPALREQFASAVDQALLVGALVGALTAALAGILVALRLSGPIRQLGASARALAGGHYRAMLPHPPTTELANLATDLGSLGRSLAETESRRLALLGDVAHEMRTPLTVIDGYLEGMIDGVLPTTATDLGQITVEVRRLRRLAEDLSALSWADEGRLSLRLAPADLGALVNSETDRLRGQVEAADVTLTVELGANPTPVQVDADRVAQVVTNLIGNAVRATPAGGAIIVRCQRVHSSAVVDVIDTGEGIVDTDRERIFERFYRVADRRRSEGDIGHGVGLTIARSIARAHGGDLIAESPGRGQGATFRLTLPLEALGARQPVNSRTE